MFDEFDPDYVAEQTFKERYAEDDDDLSVWQETWAVYDPD